MSHSTIAHPRRAGSGSTTIPGRGLATTLRTTALALSTAFATAAAVAQEVKIIPVDPLHLLAGEPITLELSPANYGNPIYDNTVNFNLRTADIGVNVEAADDLHLTEASEIVSIRFAYYCLFTLGGRVDVTISIYDNNPGNTIYPGAGATLLGQYVVEDLPRQLLSLISVRYDLPERLSVPQDIWVGLSFNADDVLAVLCDPPVVGTSADLFSQNPPGGLYFFGGDPKANFWWGIYATGPGVLYLEQADPGIAGQRNTLRASGATPGNNVYFLYATAAGETAVPGCPGVVVQLNRPTIIGRDLADASGIAEFAANVPGTARGLNVVLQAVEAEACNVSNVQFQTLQ